MAYCIESVFEHEGLRCVVLLQDMGFRDGYVGIPKSHSLYGKGYCKVDALFDVHGGLTYSTRRMDGDYDYPIKTEEPLWWFGFDCGHSDDACDWDAVKAELTEDYVGNPFMHDWASMRPTDRATIKTKEYVENECKRLAEQLNDFDRTDNNEQWNWSRKDL